MGGPERVVAGVAIAAIALITAGNVITRYLTNVSFAFTEEYSIALMVVMTLCGTAAAFAANRHIRMTALTDRLPHRWQRGAETLVLLASLVMFALLAWYGGRMAWDDYRFEVTSPGLGVPQWWYTAAVPVLAVVVVLRILQRLWVGMRRHGG